MLASLGLPATELLIGSAPVSHLVLVCSQARLRPLSMGSIRPRREFAETFWALHPRDFDRNSHRHCRC